MKLTICDICKDKEKPAQRWSFLKGKKMSPAGDYDREYEAADLCDICCLDLYMLILQEAVENADARSMLCAKVLKRIKQRSMEEL